MEKKIELKDEMLENVTAGTDINGGIILNSKYSLDGHPVNCYDSNYDFDVYGKDCDTDQKDLIR